MNVAGLRLTVALPLAGHSKVRRSRIASTLLSLALVLLTVPANAQEPVYATAEQASADPDFAIQGEYSGATQAMQVIALGEGEFELVIYQGGLPGAGWDGQPPRRIDADGDVVADLVESLELARVERKSPTLGADPPAGAVVLFDGTEASLEKWQPGARRTEDGLLMEGATSRETFDDYTIHLEFRTPFQPTARGQARGNSGLYHQGRYETQILDSFGLSGENNETGGIYTVRRPDVNACFPPLVWQTYDVDFTAARYDDQGTKVADAKMTVRLNGILVHSDVPVPQPTRAAPVGAGDSPGPIYLQDHGNPVRFRNVWVLPRDPQREARRPRMPGYERFYAATALSAAPDDPHLADGGLLLAEGLGCLNCHAGRQRIWEVTVGPVLDGVAERIRPDFLVDWIRRPRELKPGTLMPDVLGSIPEDQRDPVSRAIASYLILTETERDRVDLAGDAQASERGETLYHTVGCVACHAPLDGRLAPSATSVPLGPVADKYTLDSLADFLQNPHATRPDGRMPRATTTAAEARDIATYLLRDVVLVPGAQQFSRTLYRGSWSNLPDFDQLQPEGPAEVLAGLSFAGIEPLDGFGAVYEAYLPIARAGQYTLTVGSDDGSRVVVDGKEVARVEGMHPYQQSSGTIDLDEGVHALRVEYFEAGGEERLTLEIESAEMPRMAVGPLVTQDPEGSVDRELVPTQFEPDPELVSEGKRLFASLGCANCHAFDPPGQAVDSTLQAPRWRQLNPDAGCLAEPVPERAAQYELNRAQRRSLSAVLREGNRQRPRDEWIHLTLASANCYACHERDNLGGPELGRNAFFQTTTPEMGNEGRVPPPLTGVGDKLKDAYVAQVLDQGANSRPYMLTRMPAFTYDRMKLLHQRLNKQDRQSTTLSPLPETPRALALADGRELVGNEGLACIKCHTYGGEGTPGIQAIDMLLMTKRLRRDWYHRYMLDPQQYRPGTRMPASFSEGKSVLDSIADGDPDYQLAAMWQFLLNADPDKIPSGLRPGAIELVPDQRPILYRNFLTDLSDRGIAVGYPQQIHLAWDADRMALAKVWQNQFLDASLHWQGRGPGRLGPLGDAVVPVETVAAVARVASPAAPWPDVERVTESYRFEGYVLDAQGRPRFQYAAPGLQVEDGFVPAVDEEGNRRLIRQLSVEPQSESDESAGDDAVVVRLARGSVLPDEVRDFRINDQFTIRVDGPASPELVDVQGQTELRMTLPRDRKSQIKIVYFGW